MLGHQRRLAKDLNRWTANGWVTPEGAAKIRADVAQAKGIGLAGVLGILASVLLAFAAMSFVAAHWVEMPRLGRLGLLFATLWAAYGAAGFFETRGQRVFSDASILLGAAMFGASIMLISQMFHIDGNPPDGVLLWWIGALLAGVALRSNPALALTMVLVCVWSGVWMSEREGPHWPFLLGWTLVSAAFLWQRWGPGAHLSGLALAGFIVSLGYTLENGYAHLLVTGLGLAAVGFAVAVEKMRPEWADLARVALGYAAAVAFAGLMALQFVESPTVGELAVLAAVTLVLLLALIWYGLAAHQRGALWLGYTGFSIEILSLYAKTVGTLLDTSLFFLVAGLIFAALAALAWRLHARQSSEVTS
jgi:uncharacterized membrane protein